MKTRRKPDDRSNETSGRRKKGGGHNYHVTALTIVLLVRSSEAALGDVNRVKAVEGSMAVLTCGKPGDDAVLLVVWYKGDNPIYSYDSRDMTKVASQWIDREFLGDRAYRDPSGPSDPAALVLNPVQLRDAGEFRCRVDYRAAPTKNSRIILSVIVPPQKPIIFDEHGREIQFDRTGPHPEDTDLRLTCMVSGGIPPPTVQWWRGDVLIDSTDTSRAFPRVKANLLVIRNLQRKDRGVTFSCKASNTNLAPPVTSVVTVDMYLRPTALNILSDSHPLSAGRKQEIMCEALGSHPPPAISWWLGDVPLTDFTQKDSDDGNVTISTLRLLPKREDNGKMLSCRAKNMHVEDEHMETTQQIDVYYAPQLKLHLGTNLNPDDIEEGDDVYFECKVNANPSAYKVLWKHNNMILQHNQKGGIITSSTHVALQNIARNQAGNYSCIASNVEGDGHSNNVALKVMYKPLCQLEQKRLYGLARGEKTQVSCSVEAYPAPKSFRWAFNNTAETRELQEPQLEESDGQYSSMLNYTPSSEMDYGTILCWASNMAGRQLEPCVFHIIAGGKPDPPYNCTLLNQTTDSLDVDCLVGFDGGQAQNFILEVYDQQTGVLQANVTSPISHFLVSGLSEGKSLFISIYAANTRGRSEAANLEGFTLKRAEKQTGQVTSLEIKPFVGILIGVAMTVLILVCATVIILKIQKKTQSSPEPLQPSLIDKRAIIPPIAPDTESLYGDKNPDVIRFNKDSDYQVSGPASKHLNTEGEWRLPQMTPSMASIPQNLEPHHYTDNNLESHQYGDQAVYYDDSQNLKVNIAPTYGSLDYGNGMDANIPIRPIREVVTIRTPLMLNHQQESCV